MAKRQRNYHSKGNKGKGWEVFAHNVAASLEKQHRDSQKRAKEQIARSEKRRVNSEKQWEKENAARRKLDKRREKQRLREAKNRQLAEERFAKFVQKAEAQCVKYSVDPVCALAIAEEAFENNVSLNQIGTLSVKSRVDYWNLRAPKIHDQRYKESVEELVNELLQEGAIHKFYSDDMVGDIALAKIEIGEIRGSFLGAKYLKLSHERKLYDGHIIKLCESAGKMGRILEVLVPYLIECFGKCGKVELAKFVDSECYRIYRDATIQKRKEVDDSLTAYLK